MPRGEGGAAVKDKRSESWPIREARLRRASALAEAVLEWQRFAEQRQYPRSLVEILETALRREYECGQRGRSARGAPR